MIPLKNILFIVTMLCLATNLNAQDKLLFLNGKTLEGKIITQTAFDFSFQDKKNKQYSIDKYRVFSYQKDKKETILYKYDTLIGNFLKVDDMKLFVYGERDAYKTYNSSFTNIMGLVIGTSAGYLMHKDQSFFYVTTPFIYTMLTLPFGTNIKLQKSIKNKDYFSENEYLRGYDRVARSKRTTNSLKFSFLGVGVGYLVGALIQK